MLIILSEVFIALKVLVPMVFKLIRNFHFKISYIYRYHVFRMTHIRQKKYKNTKYKFTKVYMYTFIIVP